MDRELRILQLFSSLCTIGQNPVAVERIIRNVKRRRVGVFGVMDISEDVEAPEPGDELMLWTVVAILLILWLLGLLGHIGGNFVHVLLVVVVVVVIFNLLSGRRRLL